MTKKINPKSLQNLKPPIKKGEVRNPNGRPKGALSLTTLLKKALEEDYFVYEKDEEGKVVLDEKGKPKVLKRMLKKDALIYALASKAINDKDMQAIKEIFDRIEGKVPQTNINENLNTDLTQPNLSNLSDQELEILKKINDNTN